MEMCNNMRKLHIKEFDSRKKRWTHWRQDFETSMKGAKIDPKQWVAVLPMYLDNVACDAYEKFAGPSSGNQYIQWPELVGLFEAHFQEKTNPIIALLQLCALKFDHNKGDFAEFATGFSKRA